MAKRTLAKEEINVPHTKIVAPSWCKPDPNQPRKHYDAGKLALLTESVRKHGILQDPGVRPDGTIVWGHGRVAAAIAAGLKEITVVVLDKPMTEGEYLVLQMIENMQRADFRPYEQWLGCEQLRRLNPGWHLQDVAEALGLHPSMVTRLVSPSKCIPAVQEALKEDRIGISDCYEFSQESPDRQVELLRMRLSGASRDAIKEARRKSRSENTPTVKLSRVKIAMPKGATVVVSGNDLGMAEVVELLCETLKEARKAAEHYDVKTWQAMMKDRAKGV